MVAPGRSTSALAPISRSRRSRRRANGDSTNLLCLRRPASGSMPRCKLKPTRASWCTIPTRCARSFWPRRPRRVLGGPGTHPRPSHGVASYLKAHGYRIIPVNPHESEVLGERAYPTLREVPPEVTIDLVDVFRRPQEVMPHIEEAIAR